MLLQFATFLTYLCILNASSYTLDDLKDLTIIPYAQLKGNIQTLDGSSTIKVLSALNYYYRLDSTNKIKVWNVSSPSSSNLICSVSSNSQILDFAVEAQQGHFSYVNADKEIKVYFPSNCSINSSLVIPYSTNGIGLFISYTYIIITFQSKAVERVDSLGYRYYRKNLTAAADIHFNKIQGSILKYAHCVKPIDSNLGLSQFVVAYNESSYFQNHGYWGDQWSSNYDPDSSLQQNTYSWSIKTVTFDYDCGFLYAVHKPPLNKITVIYHDKTKFINQVNFPIEVQSATSFDQKKWMLSVFFSNNSVVFYNVSDTTMPNSKQGEVGALKNFKYLFQNNMSSLEEKNVFSRNVSQFYVATSTSSSIYKVQCPGHVTLGMGLCLDSFDQYVQQNSQYSQLKYIFTAIKVMAYLIVFLQVTPFASIFLRFINFWTICSIYSMVNISTAQPLTSVLFSIYQLINASLFQLMGISFSVSISDEEKATGKYQDQYEITSNFASIIIEPVIITTCMCLLLYGFEWIKHKYFTQTNKKKFRINKIKIFLAQYVSFLNIFMFPVTFVFLGMYHSSIKQKINIYFHMIFICFGIMLPFVIIFLNGAKIKVKVKAKMETETKKNIQNKSIGYFTKKSIKNNDPEIQFIQEQVSVLTFEYLQFSYICLVNIIMPILGTITRPQWFVFVCGGLIFCGIIVDSKRQVWRINSIVMSVELMIFHFCFCLHLIPNLSDKTKFIISITALILLMIGALHQLITLVLRSLVDLYQILCKNNTHKVQDESQNSQLKLKSIKLNKNENEKVQTSKQPSIKIKSRVILKKSCEKQGQNSNTKKIIIEMINNEGKPNQNIFPQPSNIIQNINSSLKNSQIVPERKFISMKSKIIKKRTERLLNDNLIVESANSSSKKQNNSSMPYDKAQGIDLSIVKNNNLKNQKKEIEQKQTNSEEEQINNRKVLKRMTTIRAKLKNQKIKLRQSNQKMTVDKSKVFLLNQKHYNYNVQDQEFKN